jgi:hypothetical protein
MLTFVKAHARWFVVVAFAVAMAWLESATVYYLRTLVDRIEPYQRDPLPIRGILGQVELVREAATLLMLFAVGLLAGRTWRARWGYAAIAFGAWDIFYYVFLRLMCGWPRTLLDWDVLFLIPLPWWGPVLAPVSIAVLMLVWGTIVTESDQAAQPSLTTRGAWALNATGIALALYVFMADSLQQLPQLNAGMVYALPTSFNWPLFLAALALMGAPLIAIGVRPWSDRGQTAGRPVSDHALIGD